MNLINIVDNFFNLSAEEADIYRGIPNTGPERFLHPFYEDANYRSWHATLNFELCFFFF